MSDEMELELLKALNNGTLSKAEYEQQLTTYRSGASTSNAKAEWEQLCELPIAAPSGNTVPVVRATKSTKGGVATYGLTIAVKGPKSDIKRMFIPEDRLDALARNIEVVKRAITKSRGQ